MEGSLRVVVPADIGQHDTQIDHGRHFGDRIFHFARKLDCFLQTSERRRRVDDVAGEVPMQRKRASQQAAVGKVAANVDRALEQRPHLLRTPECVESGDDREHRSDVGVGASFGRPQLALQSVELDQHVAGGAS